MPDPYFELLDATIEYIQDLKAHGTRWLAVDPANLRDLPPRRAAAPPRRPASEPVRLPSVHEAAEPAARVSRVDIPPAPLVASAGEKAAAMAELRSRVLTCTRCLHLANSRKNVVFGVGDTRSPLLFVGEAPGAEEDAQGEPFVGAAGQLLTRIIKTMGFSRETVYIANVLKCRPDTPGQAYGNRKPTSEEMQTCLPYLREQIGIIRPKVIVALGGTALEGLFGRAIPITRARGQWQDFNDIPVMPTFHPSYLLRNQSPAVKRQVWEDMLAVLEKLGLPITEKQRNYFK